MPHPVSVDGILLRHPAGQHKIGVRVPGGSHCQNCEYLRRKPDSDHCANALWVMAPKSQDGGGGSTKLPTSAVNWCRDYWED